MPTVKIYADCADLAHIERYAQRPDVNGFTTNPVLLRDCGTVDYPSYVRRLAELTGSRPVSLATLAADPDGIRARAHEIAAWHPHAYVKVPVVGAQGERNASLIGDLAADGIRVNATAVFTEKHVEEVLDSVGPTAPLIVSVFAGRIADTGRDPVQAVRAAVALCAAFPAVEVLWASSREVYNVVQAAEAGSDIITLPPPLLDRLANFERDLDEYASATVAEFDAAALEVHSGR